MFPDITHDDIIDVHNDIGLMAASERKLAAIVNDCNLEPGVKVLDIGSGWGLFLRYAVPRGSQVHSITISNASFVYLNNFVNDNKWDDLMNVSLINCMFRYNWTCIKI